MIAIRSIDNSDARKQVFCFSSFHVKPRMLPNIRGCAPLRLAYDFVTRLSPGRTSQTISHTQPIWRLQSAMGHHTVVIKEFPEEIQQELRDGADFVQNASYTKATTETYSACNEVGPLVELFPKVLALLSGEHSESETRMNAIRLDNFAKLPAKKGVTIVLIPICSSDEIPKVGSKDLMFGKYARVDAEDLAELEITVAGTTYFLLLLCQPKDG